MKIRITVQSKLEMGRLCYELGSRQIAAEITEDGVRCPYDEALYHSLRTLGFRAEKAEDTQAQSAVHVQSTGSSSSVTFTYSTTTTAK